MPTERRDPPRIVVAESNANLRLRSSAIDDGPIPFADFLRAAGAAVVDVTAADGAILLDHQPGVLRRVRAAGMGQDACVLVRTEPPSVFPAQYRSSVESRYRRVITVGGDPGLFGPRRLTVPWPQDFTQVRSAVRPPSERDRLAVMVSTDRGSPVLHSMYGLRRQVAAITDRDEVALAGAMWRATTWERVLQRTRSGAWAARSGVLPDPRPLFDGVLATYGPVLGRVPDGGKADLLAHYRFTIAIENWMGYMSEKLFDAMCAGCVPVYVGPDPTVWGIPAGAVLHVEPDARSVVAAVRSTSLAQADEIAAEGQAWLRGAAAHQLSRDVVLSDLARMCLEQ